MVDISVSPGILGWIKEILEKAIFKSSYIISHQNYLSWKATTRYKQVKNLFEYKLLLENRYLTNDESPASKIIFKIIDQDILRIRAFIIAEKGKLQYQDMVSMHVRGQEITVIHLSRIPLKEIIVCSNGISTTYDDVRIEGEVTKEGGSVIKFDSLWGSPTYTEFLNSSWDRKWGKIWNLDYLQDQKKNFRHSLVHRLAGSLAYLNIRPTARKQSFTQIIYRYWCIFVVNIIANERVTNFIFWCLVFTRIKRLKHNSKIQRTV